MGALFIKSDLRNSGVKAFLIKFLLEEGDIKDRRKEGFLPRVINLRRKGTNLTKLMESITGNIFSETRNLKDFATKENSF